MLFISCINILHINKEKQNIAFYKSVFLSFTYFLYTLTRIFSFIYTYIYMYIYIYIYIYTYIYILIYIYIYIYIFI